MPAAITTALRNAWSTATAAQPAHRPTHLPPLHRIRPLQVYYPVAPEVYRDLLWEDVDVADPVEYTFCRYTPVTTEVRGEAAWWGGTQSGEGGGRACRIRRIVDGCLLGRLHAWPGVVCALLGTFLFSTWQRCTPRCRMLMPRPCARTRATLAATATACACSTSSAGTSSCSFA